MNIEIKLKLKLMEIKIKGLKDVQLLILLARLAWFWEAQVWSLAKIKITLLCKSGFNL